MKEAFRTDVFICDRAGANNVCVNNLYSNLLVNSLRLPCMAHIASTTQCRTYNSIATDVSGQIATSLAMMQGGSCTSLRQHLQDVIWESARVQKGVGSDAMDVARMESLLSLCLPGGKKERHDRRCKLRTLLHGDLGSEVIVITVPDVAAFNVDEWAADLAEELLPKTIPPFPRTRWCNGADSQGSYTLLANSYNLLVRAGLRWLGERDAKSAAARSRQQQAIKTPGAWVMPSSDEDEAPGQVAAAPGGPEKVDNPSQVWAEFNARQRKSSRRFLLSRPAHRLVVAHITLDLSVSFLRYIEFVASRRWAVGQMAKLADGEQFSCRVLELHRHAESRTHKLYVDLLEDQGLWAALHVRGRTLGMSSLAFALLSTAGCALEQLAFRILRQPLYQLLMMACDATDARARRLHSFPHCRLDAWTMAVLERWPTPEALLSHEFRMFVTAVSSQLRLDIIGQETLNAQLRRLALKGQSWMEKLEHLSAASFCQRCRTAERRFSMSFQDEANEDEAGAAASARVRPRDRRRRCDEPYEGPDGRRVMKKPAGSAGGGGLQRTHVSDFLKGRPGPKSKEERVAWMAEANRYDKEQKARAGSPLLRDAQARASASTKRHKELGAAASSFGRSLRRRTRAAPPAAVSGSSSVDDGVLELLHATRGQLALFDAVMTEEARKTAEEHSVKQLQKVAGWGTLARAEQPEVLPGCKAHCVQPTPSARTVECELRMSDIRLPARNVASRALASVDQNSGVQGRLLKTWEEEHKLVVEKESAPLLPPPPPSDPDKPPRPPPSHPLSLCQRACACVCGAAQSPEQRQERLPHTVGTLVKTLGYVLRRFFQNNGPGHVCYGQNLAVIRLHHPGEEVLWLHVGFGNITDADFTFQRLVPCEQCVHPVIAEMASLHPHGCVLIRQDMPTSGFHVLKGMNTSLKWTVELWQLSVTSKVVIPLFLPLAAVEPMQPVVCEVLLKLPKARSSGDRAAVADGRPARRRPLAAAAALPRPLALLDGDPSEQQQPEADGDDDDELAQRLYDEQVRGAWEVAESEEGDVAEGIAVESESSDSSLEPWPTRQRHPSPDSPRRSAAAAAAAAEAPPPPPPPPDDGDAERVTGPRRQKRANFPRYDYYPELNADGDMVTSYIRLSHTIGKPFMDMRAVCALHGCTRSVGCRKKDQWVPCGPGWRMLLMLEVGKPIWLTSQMRPRDRCYVGSSNLCQTTQNGLLRKPADQVWESRSDIHDCIGNRFSLLATCCQPGSP